MMSDNNYKLLMLTSEDADATQICYQAKGTLNHASTKLWEVGNSGVDAKKLGVHIICGNMEILSDLRVHIILGVYYTQKIMVNRVVQLSTGVLGCVEYRCTRLC